MAAVQQLSGTIVVIIIAVGVQACIILFIFAKRQIQRFALRNRRGPHMSIGHGKFKRKSSGATPNCLQMSEILLHLFYVNLSLRWP